MVSLFAWLGFSGPSQAVYRGDNVDTLSEGDRQTFLRLYPIPSGPITLNPQLFSWINIGKTSIISALVLDTVDGIDEDDRQILLRLYKLSIAGGGGAFEGRKRFSWINMNAPWRAAYVQDGVAGVPFLDRKTFLNLYRLNETIVAPGSVSIPALVHFNRLGMM